MTDVVTNVEQEQVLYAEGKKIVVISDFAFEGSGYFYICVPLLTKLSQWGYKITVVGLSYQGEEHNYPFTVIPCKDTTDAQTVVHNLCQIPSHSPDAIIVALDIPLQINFQQKFQPYGRKYIAITPLENGPLTQSWAAPMFNMDWVFFISELGKQEALKAGVKNVDHIEVGIDSTFWRVPTPDEKANIRKGMGIEEDEFVILTVADNQERKNLWAALATTCMLSYEISYPELLAVCTGQRKISEFPRSENKVRHVLVTRVETPFGWKIRDLALKMGINKELMTMNRGMPLENLWSLYAMSDCFLLTSKAEGLGMIILEAMATGLPVVGTDTGAIHELLADGRGFPIRPEFEFIDVWGDSLRAMIDIGIAADVIETNVMGNLNPAFPKTARAYIETRTWDKPARQLHEKIQELTRQIP